MYRKIDLIVDSDESRKLALKESIDHYKSIMLIMRKKGKLRQSQISPI